MKTSPSLMLKSAVLGGQVPLPGGLPLPDGTEVLILPMSWLSAETGPKGNAGKSRAKTRTRFVSEDLVGCHEGDGRAATNAAVRAMLRKKKQG